MFPKPCHVGYKNRVRSAHCRAMLQSKAKVDTITFIAAISACENAGKWVKAVQHVSP